MTLHWHSPGKGKESLPVLDVVVYCEGYTVKSKQTKRKKKKRFYFMRLRLNISIFAVIGLPFNGVLEVGLADSAVVEEYGRAGAVLPSHRA